MAFYLKGKKNKGISVLIYTVIAVLILGLGAYFIIKNRPSADTSSDQSQSQQFTSSLFDKTVGIWNSGNEKREEEGKETLGYSDYISSIMKDVDINLSIEDQSTFLANTLMEDLQVALGGSFQKEQTGTNYTKQELVSSVYSEFKDQSRALISVSTDSATGKFNPDSAVGIMDSLFNDDIDDAIALVKESGSNVAKIDTDYAVIDTTKTGGEQFGVQNDSLGTADYDAYINTTDVRKIAGNIPVVANPELASEAAKRIVSLYKESGLTLTNSETDAIEAMVANSLIAQGNVGEDLLQGPVSLAGNNSSSTFEDYANNPIAVATLDILNANSLSLDTYGERIYHAIEEAIANGVNGGKSAEQISQEVIAGLREDNNLTINEDLISNTVANSMVMANYLSNPIAATTLNILSANSLGLDMGERLYSLMENGIEKGVAEGLSVDEITEGMVNSLTDADLKVEEGDIRAMIQKAILVSANSLNQDSMPIFKGSGTIEVNSQTGNPEYKTTLCYDPSNSGDTCLAQGYISFDPASNSFTAQASAVFGDKKVGLYADPISGDVYMSLSNDDGDALYEAGKVALTSAMISSDGKFGGEFKYANRVFRYNPSSSAFEVPIAIGGGGSIKIGQNAEEGDRGVIYIDSNGNVSGKVDVDLGRSLGSASVFLSSNGRITIAKTITSGGQSIGSVGISTDGVISGSVDLGKVIGMNSFYVSFGSGGITGVTIPIGSFGVSIGKSGALSIGTFIPVAGLPIPVGISQAADGGFRLTWPGGSLGLFGGDDRSQTPPELTEDEEGGTDAGCIYFRHSYKKGLMTVRVYQEPCTKIEKEEQVERSKIIFDVYNDLLGRNPGLQEFIHWYFYSGHQLYEYPQHEEDKAYRMDETEKKLREFILGKGAYNRAEEGGLDDGNREEYEWIQDGKAPLDAPTRPTDILESNPFEATTSEETADSSSETQLTPIKDFLAALLEDMENDPGYYLSKFFDEELDEVTDDNQVNIDYDIDEETSAEATATATATTATNTTATATVAATATETESDEIQTTLVSRQGDYPVIEKTTDNNNLIITLRHGFNEIFVPTEVGYVNVKGIKNDGMVVFEYDPTYHSDPNKSWNSNIETLKPGTGYYLYNKGETDRKIRLAKRPDLATGEKDTTLKVGWNLLSQSDQSSVRLANYEVLSAKEGWSGGCDIVGLCVESKKISDLILSSGEKSRAYKKVYFLIPDDDPLKVKKFVEANVVESDNLNEIELRQGQMFWVYLFE